jgi:uncharacterized membrane protein YagU involved in acid resistance
MDPSTKSILSSSAHGALAGSIATVAMTAAMVVMHRRLPRRQRYGLPPELIVDDLMHRLDGPDSLTQRQFESLAMLVHHAYGAAMGSVYGVIAPHVRAAPIASGIGYGLAVWAVSYLGWLPALRVSASATHEPIRRNAMTFAAHVVWGASIGWLAKSSGCRRA